MKRVHAMPFGAETGSEGVRFRLWAPSAGRVMLALGDSQLPMQPLPGGWFSAQVASARPGDRYRFIPDGGPPVPDPASRCNPGGAQAASEVIDPAAFAWGDEGWRGLPWEDAAIYELHVGCFTPAGTFAGAAEKLDYLAALGVTAIELMPLADFPGRRNWGYDGVLPFAPDSVYGRPDELKRLVAEAHARGLMVILDVVYNHFGPEGNYLHSYAAPFFTDRHQTPWGAAIDFDGPASRTVRDFYIHNALYWLEEYHLDGLRLDAVHAIADDSRPDIIEEIAAAVRAGPGRERHIHLILENDRNQARYLERDAAGAPRHATAQWNDDCHHALHVLLTGERDGYYADYAGAPAARLGRCLAEGFAWQGEPSSWRGGRPRGEASTQLPPAAFVNFLQNHDQVGNRAFGERLSSLAPGEALAAAAVVLLLAPSPPLLFMGEEFASRRPFLYFCDYAGELAAAVTAGRRAEFAGFARFADPAARGRIPDPNAEASFRASALDWEEAGREPHARHLALCRALLAVRRDRLAPRLAGMNGHSGRFALLGEAALMVSWRLGDGSHLHLFANLGPVPVRCPRPAGETIEPAAGIAPGELQGGRLPPWSAAAFLAPPADGGD